MHNIGWIVFAALVAVSNGFLIQPTSAPEEPWTGRWLPHPPYVDTVTKNPLPVDIHDPKHGVKMGVKSRKCDDAKTNLTIDWNLSPSVYTCFSPTSNKYVPDWRIKPILESENIPKFYIAHHECMNKSIHYDSAVPTFGTHRPLWPRYGEYKYVPPQRWLHNLEHGGLVMLYHPCANPMEVNRLRHIVTNCLRRHIISPHPLLDPERPLALVTWGYRLTMSTVQPSIVMNFIKQHALRGPEKLAKDGQYDFGLKVPAETVSDLEDSVLCPRR